MSTPAGESPDVQEPAADTPQQPRRWSMARLASTLDDLNKVLVAVGAIIVAAGVIIGGVFTVIAIVGRNSGATSPSSSHGPTGSTSRSAAPSSIQPARCLDKLTVPADSGNDTLISVALTCGVPAGNTLYLVAEIQDADGQGHTRYYLASWAIDRNQPEQTYCAHTTSGVSRRYYLISATAAQFGIIEDSLVDKGATTLAGAPAVSNPQPNTNDGSVATC